jgi:hypothetical protein
VFELPARTNQLHKARRSSHAFNIGLRLSALRQAVESSLTRWEKTVAHHQNLLYLTIRFKQGLRLSLS